MKSLVSPSVDNLDVLPSVGRSVEMYSVDLPVEEYSDEVSRPGSVSVELSVLAVDTEAVFKVSRVCSCVEWGNVTRSAPSHPQGRVVLPNPLSVDPELLTAAVDLIDVSCSTDVNCPDEVDILSLSVLT